MFASLYYNLGDIKSVDKCYQIYLKIIQKNYGDTSLELANSYFSIGVYFMQTKRFIKAVALFKNCLKIREENFGKIHEGIADCLTNIGICFLVASSEPDTIGL